MSKGKHGFLWWTFVGWWWWPCRALAWDLPRAIVRGIKRLAAQEPPAVPVEAQAVPVEAQAVPVEAPAEQKEEAKNWAKRDQFKIYKVAGTSYRLDSLMELAEENEEYSYGKERLIEEELTYRRVWKYEFYTGAAELVPEPDNSYDPNAIKVTLSGRHVGYIKAGSCAHLLKLLREGRIGKLYADAGGGPYKYVSCTDYTEDGDEIYEMEQGETPYYVRLEVEER